MFNNPADASLGPHGAVGSKMVPGIAAWAGELCPAPHWLPCDPYYSLVCVALPNQDMHFFVFCTRFPKFPNSPIFGELVFQMFSTGAVHVLHYWNYWSPMEVPVVHAPFRLAKFFFHR